MCKNTAKHKVTTKDLAARLGVSTATVHRAIYGKQGVGDVLRQKILKEVEKANYEIDGTASILRREEIHIAVLLPVPSGEGRYFFRGLWEGIHEYEGEWKKQKIRVTFVKNDLDISEMSEALKNLYDSTDKELQGLITMCDDVESSIWISRFARRGTKVVLVASSNEETAALCLVKASRTNMGALAARLVNMICGKTDGEVLCVNGSGKILSCRRILKGFYGNLNPGLRYMEILEKGIGEYEARLKAVLSLHLPHVIFCSSARTTYHVCRIVQDMGISGKVAVIGMDIFEELKPFLKTAR